MTILGTQYEVRMCYSILSVDSVDSVDSVPYYTSRGWLVCIMLHPWSRAHPLFLPFTSYWFERLCAHALMPDACGLDTPDLRRLHAPQREARAR